VSRTVPEVQYGSYSVFGEKKGLISKAEAKGIDQVLS